MNEEKRFSWLTSHTSSQFFALHGWHDCNYHQSILEMLMQEMHKQSITYQENETLHSCFFMEKIKVLFTNWDPYMFELMIDRTTHKVKLFLELTPAHKFN